MQERSYESEHNGLIRVNEFGEVLVDGYKQTSYRYGNLWADAFTQINTPPNVARILMLGLAGGGAISAIKAAYPNAEITIVEYDPVMVRVATELDTIQGAEVITKDALDALDAFTTDFDLILVDIFEGIAPSQLLLMPEFWGAVGRRLTEHGIAIVNVAGSPDYLELPQSLFAHNVSWRYDTNVFGAFWNSYGTV